VPRGAGEGALAEGMALCQGCGHPGHCHLQGRDVYQCNRCKRQVSLTSGALFAQTKLPLRTWLTGFAVEKRLWRSTC